MGNESSKVVANNNNNNTNKIITKDKCIDIHIENDTNNNICPITYEKIVIPYSLQCGHIFEKESIEKWLKKNNSCPICRTQQKYDNEDDKEYNDANVETFLIKSDDELIDFGLIANTKFTIKTDFMDNLNKIIALINSNFERDPVEICIPNIMPNILFHPGQILRLNIKHGKIIEYY
jgi:hypothetical protein